VVSRGLPTWMEVWLWVVMAAGVLAVIIAIFNPWSLADRGFEYGERQRIGRLRLGINFYARTPESYRIFLGLVGVVLIFIAFLVLAGS